LSMMGDVDETLLIEYLHGVITAEVADEVAAVFGDQPAFPRRIEIDRPDNEVRRFPGWATAVLVISDESQGVCSWGVPIGVAAPPVVVGGELGEMGGSDETTIVYAPSVEHFIAARRWDGACLREPLLQAQAEELDGSTLDFLRGLFREVLPTKGHPATAQHRFEDETSKVLLWSGPGQCDWWISATDPSTLRAVVERLLPLSDLRSSLWANDSIGEELLRQVRSE
jgi:hypothetical protein